MPSMLKTLLESISEKKRHAPAILLTALAPMFIRTALADSTTFSLAVLESNGHYGLETPTRMRASVFKISHRSRTGSVSLAIPYLDINGSASLLYEDIDTGELFLVDEDDHRAGLGDVIIKFDHKAWEDVIKDKRIDIGGSVKLATGDQENQLGSDTTDWSVFISARSWKKNNLLTGQIGYQISGNSEFAERNNRFFLSAHFYRVFNPSWGAGVSVRFKQRFEEAYDDQKSIGLFLSHRINSAWNTSLRLNHGLSESVSRNSLGLEVSYQLR